MALLQSPWRIALQAASMETADDEQAVSKATEGPDDPKKWLILPGTKALRVPNAEKAFDG